MSDTSEIRIVLRPLTDARPWSVRLRLALKTLLRRDRLACVRVEALPGDTAPPGKRKRDGKA